jgi:predicted TIM-barrel fold metal-dependent hydrolase
VLDAYGVQHALLVRPNSGYGANNRCLLSAIARGQGRFKGVAVVAHDASLAQLQDLQAQGIVGIAFNYALHGLDYYRNTTPLMDRLAALDMFVQVQVENERMHTLAPALLGSGAKLLIDHCGRPDITQCLAGKGFTALLSLASSPRTDRRVWRRPLPLGIRLALPQSPASPGLWAAAAAVYTGCASCARAAQNALGHTAAFV